MFEFTFEDKIESKYCYVGDFHDPLAVVQDRETLLYGYIDKSGKEVIPCKYLEANDFSEGLAVVKSELGYFYIDRFDQNIFSKYFLNAQPFFKNLGAVQNEEKGWGYISKNGLFIIAQDNAICFPNKEGRALFQKKPGQAFMFDGFITREIEGDWHTPFQEGFAILKRANEFIIVDEELNVRHKLSMDNVKDIFPSSCKLFRVIHRNGKVGYLNHSFTYQIPCMYNSGRDFREDVAIVNMSPEILSFTDINGVATAFIKDIQYKTLGDFYEGRALVSNTNGYGYINRKGKNIIPCTYQNARNFSEGLAYIQDDNLHFFIDSSGKKKIELSRIYRSTLRYGSKIVDLKAYSKQELNNLKMVALKAAKKEIFEEIELDIIQAQNTIK